MTIKAILACDEEGGVAKEGTLPWPKNSTDLKWFKKHTTGHTIIMGSSTWVDPHMPCPMPNRINIVATSTPDKYTGAHGYISGNLSENVTGLDSDDSTVWVIGGPNIINQTLDVIEEFYISRIPGTYDCDRFLPLKKIETLFKLDYEEKHIGVTFQIWRKRK